MKAPGPMSVFVPLTRSQGCRARLGRVPLRLPALELTTVKYVLNYCNYIVRSSSDPLASLLPPFPIFPPTSPSNLVSPRLQVRDWQNLFRTINSNQNDKRALNSQRALEMNLTGILRGFKVPMSFSTASLHPTTWRRTAPFPASLISSANAPPY